MARAHRPSIHGGLGNEIDRNGSAVEAMAATGSVTGKDSSGAGLVGAPLPSRDCANLRRANGCRSHGGTDRGTLSGNPDGVDAAREVPPPAQIGQRVCLAARRPRRVPLTLSRQSRWWVGRVAQIHSGLSAICGAFGRPLRGRDDEYARRVAGGDRTTMLDAVAHAIRQLEQVRDQIEKAMAGAATTGAEPGTAEKIEVLRERAERSENLWQEGDTVREHR